MRKTLLNITQGAKYIQNILAQKCSDIATNTMRESPPIKRSKSSLEPHQK